MKTVWTFHATIAAPIEKVKELFFDVKEGTFNDLSAPLLLVGKGQGKITYDRVMYVAEFEDTHREYISIDSGKNMVAVQGEWWYRGEYTFTPIGEQTNVQLEVSNLADQEWMVSLMNIGAQRKHELAFLSLCRMAERKMADDAMIQ